MYNIYIIIIIIIIYIFIWRQYAKGSEAPTSSLVTIGSVK